MKEIENAQITNVSLTMEDHGCLTFWLTLEGEGWGCGFGGYCIGKGFLGATEFTVERGDGLEAMMRIMDVVGVSKWEDLKGKYLRVQFTGCGWGGRVNVIGNLLKDKWFDIKEFFKTKQQEVEDGKDKQ